MPKLTPADKLRHKAEKLVATLPTIEGLDGGFIPSARIEINIDYNCFRIAIHLEGNENLLIADYYGEFHHPVWINPLLEKWADKNQGFFEWSHPSEIVFFPN